jgi:hypothetical protein
VSARKKTAKPVLDECQECNGSGQCQQLCEACRVPLTEANWRSKNEAYVCNACTKVENAAHPTGGYSHMGCKCAGCAA